MTPVTSNNLRSGASTAATNGVTPVQSPVTQADYANSSKKITEQNLENISGITSLRFPKDIGRYYLKIEVKKYDRNISSMAVGGFGTGGASISKATHTLNTDGIIYLPLPQDIRDMNSVNYSEEGIIDTSALVGSVSSGFADSFTARTNKFFASNPKLGMAAAAAEKIGGAVASATAKAGMAAAGVAPNQFLTILLKGPQYKKHSFTWKLYPKNAGESEEIRKIVQVLREQMRTNVSMQGFVFEFPRVFQLSFAPEHSQYMFEFKPAVIEAMSVNYTPSGSPSLYNSTGAPDGIELTINFIELEYWLNSSTNMLFGSGK